MEWHVTTNSPGETLELGGRLANCLMGETVVGLVGPLGAGKTLLVRGVAQANAGGSCEVSSPTFTLIQEYPGRLTLYHLDMYRLSKSTDPILLGVDEMIRPDSAVLVEWGDRISGRLPEDVLWVHIEPVSQEDRLFRFVAKGAGSSDVLCRLSASYVDTSVRQS